MMRLRENEDGISSVISVALMIVIAVIIVAVIASLVLGVASEIPDTKVVAVTARVSPLTKEMAVLYENLYNTSPDPTSRYLVVTLYSDAGDTSVPSMTIDPRPTKTTDPRPSLTIDPGPTKTTDPRPSLTIDPGPTRTIGPIPSRTIGPDPSKTISPIPSRTIGPEPSRTIGPEPSKTIGPEPSKTIDPIPSMTIDPRPSMTIGPIPSKTIAPTTTPVWGLDLTLMVNGTYAGGARGLNVGDSFISEIPVIPGDCHAIVVAKFKDGSEQIILNRHF